MIDAAILLAAGFATRLAPLSRVRAKAALPVAGEVLIRRQLRWLAAAGIRRVVVNLHHLPSTITSRVGHGDDLGLDVRYSWEPVVLGSAGGPRRAFDLLDADRALVVNGDTLTDLNLAALIAAHERVRPLVTMASTPHALAGYNALVLDDDSRLLGVARAGAAPRADWTGRRHVHFIGVQVVERATFTGVSPDAPSETLKQVYPALLARAADAVCVHPAPVTFHDIGTPADYLATVAAVAAAEAQTLDRGDDVHIDGSADVAGTVIWDRVTVGAGAVVHDAILADDVHVPPGTALTGVAVVPAACAAGLSGRPLGNLWIAPLGPRHG